MNSDKAKIPDKGASDWQAIDIFLFSNGQQYTPPRKYHLCNEELNWWKTTLSFLARAQYGSLSPSEHEPATRQTNITYVLHSIIDLYTIDGHKVEGPLELSNGNAYVAVTPPDSFIDSGYDKYLIKASRSWEKRQARKSSSLEITVPATILSKSDIHFEDRKALVNSNTMEAVTANTHEEQLNMNVRPLTQNQQTFRRSTPTTIKTVEKKRPPSIQRTSILRKLSTPIASPPMNRKISLKSNDIPLKRNSKGPVKTSEKLTPSNNNKVNSKIVSKTLNTKKETVPTLLKTKVNERSTDMITSSVTKISTSKHKSSITDNTQIENVIDDKDIIVVSNIYKNSRGEISTVMADELENQILFENSQNIVEESLETEPVNSLGHAVKSNGILGNINLANDTKTLPIITSPIKVVHAPKARLLLNSVIDVDQPARNNYLAFINKGDVVNLKLQIEIRNGDGAVCTRPEKNIDLRHSYANIKTKKDSHINIEEEIIVHSTSLQSLLAKEFTQGVGADEKCKIVIVKCACCDQYNEPQSHGKENEKYVILLPNIRREESITSCHCEREIPSNKEELVEEDKPHVESILHPVKKTLSAASLETLVKTKHKQETIITQKGTEIPLSKLDSSIFHSEETQRNVNVIAVSHEKLTEKEDSKIKFIIDEPDSDPETEGTELLEFKNNQTTVVTDKYTQTDWCSILLEARRHGDGHYSFHLPPLNVLRSCYL